jgi:hypothetical protein
MRNPQISMILSEEYCVPDPYMFCSIINLTSVCCGAALFGLAGSSVSDFTPP